MKNLKLIFIFLLLKFSLIIQAQPNHFFPMENGVWEEVHVGFTGDPYPIYIVTCGDTVINNETHAKLYEIHLDSLGNEMTRTYIAATKTGADVVDCIIAGTQNSFVLYDFSIETGQSITLESTWLGLPTTFTVTSNSLMSDNAGLIRRVINLESNTSSEVWIEGMGSNKGVLNRGHPVIADFESSLNCFKYEDILIWSNDTNMPTCEFSFTEICGTTSLDDFSFFDKIKMQVSPNPMAVEATIQIEGLDLLSQPEIRIYNLQGQLIRKLMELNEEKLLFLRKDLKAGMYVFELFDTKTTFALRKKIIIF